MAASLEPILDKLKKIENNKAKFHTQCIKLADGKFLKNKFHIGNYKKDEIVDLCKQHPALARRLILLITAGQLPIASDNQNISVNGLARLHPNDLQVQLVAAGKIRKNRIPVVIQFLDPDKCSEATKNFFVLFDNYAHLISDPIELTEYETCIKKQVFNQEKLSRSLLEALSDEEITPIRKHKDKNIACSFDILITTIHIKVAKEVLTPSFVKILLSFFGLSRNISQEINTSAIIKRINDPAEDEINKLDLIEILLAKHVLQRQYWKDLTDQEWKSLTNYLKSKLESKQKNAGENFARYFNLYNVAKERMTFLEMKNHNLQIDQQTNPIETNPESSEHTEISDNSDSNVVHINPIDHDPVVASADQLNETIANPKFEKPSVRIDLDSLYLEGRPTVESNLKATKTFYRTNSTNKLLDILYKNNFRTNNQNIADAISPNISQNVLSLEQSQLSITQEKVTNNQTAPSFAITLDSHVNTTTFTGQQALTLEQSKQTLTFEQSKHALTLEQSKQALTLEQSIQALTLSSSKNALTLDSSSSIPSKKHGFSFIELSISVDEIDGNDNLDPFVLDEKPTFINESDSQPRCNTPKNSVSLPAEFNNLSPITRPESDLKNKHGHSHSQPDLTKLQTQFKKTFQEIMAASEQHTSKTDNLDNPVATSLTGKTQGEDQPQLGDFSSQAALSISYDKNGKASLDTSKNISDLSAISLSNGSTPVHTPIKQRVN